MAILQNFKEMRRKTKRKALRGGTTTLLLTK
jgi:hypothetical protein